jgi:hypothetical protein
MPSTIPWTKQRFVASYLGDRRHALYEKALASLETSPLVEEDSHLKTFVKTEKTFEYSAFADQVYDDLKREPVPRPIQPRDPRYNVEVGRYIKPLEPCLFKGIDRVRQDQGQQGPCVMKGHNLWERAKILREQWMLYPKPCWIKADASRFDGHVSKIALRWEHGIYKQKVSYGGRDEERDFAKYLKWQETMRGRAWTADGFLSYRLNGHRATGDMNTGCGNTLLSIAMWDSYSRMKGVQCAIFGDGDDTIIMLPDERMLQWYLMGVDAWFLEMGFVMKVEAFGSDFSQLEFCQTRPIEVRPGEWLMVRNPKSAFAKDHHSQTFWTSELDMRAWLKAVSEGGEAIAGDVPVFGALYQAYGRLAGDARPRADYYDLPYVMLQMRMGAGRRYFARPSDSARVSFYEAYGITPGEQQLIEDEFSDLEVGWPPERVDAANVDGSYLVGCRTWIGL